MPTTNEKKLLPLFLLQALKEHADDGEVIDDEGVRFLSWKQLEAYVENEYGMQIQKRALERNLDDLIETGLEHPELGFEIECLKKERKYGKGVQVMSLGWRLSKASEFETSEVRMLIDSALASSVIPPKQTKQLVDKLIELSPGPIVIPKVEHEGYNPVTNPDFFLNLELINEAIQKKKQITFVIGEFDNNGKLRKPEGRGGFTRKCSPLQLLVSKGHYYLLATFPGAQNDFKFRVDRMLDVKILDEDIPVDVSSDDINIAKYREQHSYMMSGKVMNVTFRISKNSLHSLFDQFGSNVHPFNELEETVDVQLKSALFSVLFWALQYYRYVEVIEPQELRDELERAGKTIAKMYKGEPSQVSLAERQ